MRRLARLVAVTALVWAALVPAGQAATESGDAGELPATSQDLGAEPTLDTIAGSLDGLADRDVYRICVAAGGGFSASTVGGTEVDTQLFLLDLGGRGVYANDDAPGVLGQSALPAGDPLTPSTAGTYFLAVARYNQDPVDEQGAPLFADVVDTVGPLGGDPIAAWTAGREGISGAYVVALTGAVGCAPPDETAPTVALRSPADGAVFRPGDEVLADYDCADEEGGSGLVTCSGDVASGEPIDTSATGAHTFSVRAADAAGNEIVETVAYSVDFEFAFDGFLWPLENPPAVNRARAGRAISVRFRLGGDQGDDVLARRYPRSAEVDCATFADADPDSAEPTDSRWWWRRWDDGLRYQPWSDSYLYRWQTERRWAGDCRQLIVKLGDGSIRRANVRFTGRRPHWQWPWWWQRGDHRGDRGLGWERDSGRDRDFDRD